jgi:aminobenzoyl-glutamate utilization protein B
MTGCSASVRWVTKTRVGLTYHDMTDLTFANMELVGPPRFLRRGVSIRPQIQSNLGLEPMANPFLDDNERLMPPGEYESRLRRALPEWQTHYTSDDYVDYTWHAPTVRLLTMRPRLRPPSPDYEYPAWAHNALGGLPAAINPGIFLGAKTIAATLLDLLTEPAKLTAICTPGPPQSGSNTDSEPLFNCGGSLPSGAARTTQRYRCQLRTRRAVAEKVIRRNIGENEANLYMVS